MALRPHHDRGHRQGDEMAALLAVSDGDAPGLDARARRVRQAVWERLQAQVRARKRRRKLVAAVALTAVAGLAANLVPPSWHGERPETAAFVVERVTGPAWLREEREETVVRNAASGDGFGVATGIVTGSAGRLALRAPSGHSVRLDVDSAVRIASEQTLVLERGAIYVDSGAQAAGRLPAMRIRTRYGLLEEVGTQFEVRAGESDVVVRVREGRVRIHHGEAATSVVAGEAARVDAGSVSITGTVPVSGESWRWAHQVAPLVNLRGQTVRAFLDWLCREAGWQLILADADVAREAERITLGGTIDGLSFEDALVNVLMASRMHHRLEGSTLTVSSKPLR